MLQRAQEEQESMTGCTVRARQCGIWAVVDRYEETYVTRVYNKASQSTQLSSIGLRHIGQTICLLKAHYFKLKSWIYQALWHRSLLHVIDEGWKQHSREKSDGSLLFEGKDSANLFSGYKNTRKSSPNANLWPYSWGRLSVDGKNNITSRRVIQATQRVQD